MRFMTQFRQQSPVFKRHQDLWVLKTEDTNGELNFDMALLTYDQQGAAVIVPSNNCYTNYYSYFNDPFYFLYFYYNYYYYYIFYYSYYCYIYYYSYFFYCGYIS